jgi:hypothetical protein
MMKFLPAAAILVVFSLNAFSQYSYYKEAVITKTNSGILRGYVEKESEGSLSYGLNYKIFPEDKEITRFPISDIEQVVFLEDSTVFQKVRYIHRNMYDSLKIVEDRLAKRLLTGYAELFKLQLHPEELNIILEQNNTFVYIVRIDTNYYLLEQKEYLEGINYKLRKNYIGVLTYILRDHDKLRNMVTDLEFNDDEITSIIYSLNLEYSEIPSEVLYVREKMVINHGPSLSFGLLNNYDGLEGSVYAAGYSAGFCYPEFNEHIFTEIGLIVEQIVATDVNEIQSTGTYYKIPISVNYKINNNKVSPFISVSLIPCLMNENSEVFVGFTTGLTLYKRYVVSFTLESRELKLDSQRILFFNLGYKFGN